MIEIATLRLDSTFQSMRSLLLLPRAIRFFVVNLTKKRANSLGDAVTLVIAGRVHNNACPTGALRSTKSRASAWKMSGFGERAEDVGLLN